MIRWIRLVRYNLNTIGVTIWLIIFYVDDVRILTSPIPKGWRWVEKLQSNNTWERGKWVVRDPLASKSEFRFTQEAETEDRIRDEPDLQRNAELVRQMLSGVDKDLEFTMEMSEDFRDKRIPTLDFNIWLDTVDGRWQLHLGEG